MRPGSTILVAAASVLLATLGIASAAFGGEGHRVCVTVFLSKDCPGCEPIRQENLDRLARKIGCAVIPRYLSVEDPKNYDLLVRIEQRFKDEGNELPVVFIGSHVLGGSEEIGAKLEELVRRYAQSGGAESELEIESTYQSVVSKPADPAARPVYLGYFDAPGCEHCRRVRFLLRQLTSDFPTVQLRTWSTSERGNVILQEALGERLGVSGPRRLLTPAVIVGNHAFIQHEITDRALREYLSSVLVTGTECPWEGELDLAAAEWRLNERFRAVSLGAIVAGGLIDGVNPCAFATLILFISYMRAAGRERGKLLAVGGSFILAVFLVYLAVGLGLWQVVSFADRLPYVDAAVTWAVVALCVVLAVYSLADAVKAARGRHREITLQLPAALKRKIQSVLIRFGRTRYLVLGGLLIGGLISLLELVCTGQIYFPLIKLMVSSAGPDRLRAVGLLLVYNLCFILPLVAIFSSAYWGLSSERLTALLRKNMAATKVVTALFFAALAVLMVASRHP